MLEDHERSICQGCNQPLAETLDPSTRRRYTTRLYACNGCESRQIAIDDHAESQRKAGLPAAGIRAVVTPDF